MEGSNCRTVFGLNEKGPKQIDQVRHFVFDPRFFVTL